MEQFLSAKYLSGRSANQKIGVVGYTTGKALEVIGRVGIGSTVFVPTTDLDVRGSLNISGNITANDINVGAGGTINFSGGQFKNLEVSGFSTFVGYSTFRDSVNIEDNLFVGGISTFQNGPVFIGIGTSTGTLDQPLQVTGGTYISGDVGIGTTNTEGRKLYVGGDALVTGVVTATKVSTGSTGIDITYNTISGPNEIIIDPAEVGVNTGVVRIKGDLYIDGTEFIVNSTTIELADFNIGIATTVGTNLLLDGAGIGIGSTNIRKTLTYDFSSDALKSSENFDLASGKVYKINETEVLSSSQLTVANINATGVSTIGFATIKDLYVTGISTFQNGPVFIGIGTSTGTSNQPLQVTGGTYISGDVGIGTTNTEGRKLYVIGDGEFTGVVTATKVSTGSTGIDITYNTISGPNEIIIDPAGVGVNTGSVRIKGDLYVDGKEFIVDSTTIELADFNVGIATTVGTNLLLDGAGIGIGSTNIRKTLTYDFSSNALKSSENFDLALDKVYKINETEVLSSSQLTVANINAIGVSTIGFATIKDLYVTGVSTFQNGSVFIGIGTSTGTSNQLLQVDGGAYVSGNLGIGTTNPTSKLHVVGDINLPEGNNIKFGGNDRIRVVTSGAQNLSLIQLLPHPTIQPNIVELNTGGSDNTLRIAAGVNVRGGMIEFVGGNSTDNPAGSLVFRSGSTFSQGLSPERMRLFGTGQVGIGTTILTGTTNQLLQVDGGTYISGDVGIGTTIPTSKLHVVGDALVTGISTFNTGLNVGIGGTIITTTGIGSVGIGSTLPSARLTVNTPSGFIGNLLNLQVDGNIQLGVSSSGRVDTKSLFFDSLSGSNDTGFYRNGNNLIVDVSGAGRYNFSTGSFTTRNPIGFTDTDVYAADTFFHRDAANILAQRNVTNAQTFRVYNTYTSSTDFERGKLEWSSNILRIGTEKGSIGTARSLELQTDGITAVAISTTQNVGIGTTIPTSKLHVVGDTSVTGLTTTKDFEVTGIATIGTLGVTGLTTTKDFEVTGIATIGTLGVTGLTTTKDFEVTGVSTIGTLGVTGLTTTKDFEVTGVSTIGTLGVTGLTTTKDFEVTGVSTIGNVKISSGIVTAASGIVTYYGNQVIGTPSSGFKNGAFTKLSLGFNENSFTKDTINELDFILGKLIPKPPTTINNVSLSLSGTTTARLCDGFSPTNNTDGDLTPIAGTQYSRNTDNTITTNYLTQYGPGDTGTVTGYVNSVGVGTTTLSVGSNNGNYGSLQITNDKDASFSTRNPGIASEFYEIYDVRLLDAPSPDGFNKAYIQQGISTTQKVYWYEDPSTVAAPVLSVGSTTTPSSPTLLYSSGVPHYTESSSNAFTYVITCENATGDMYTTNTFMTSSGETAGFQNGGNKSYTDFDGGTNPPTRNYGVGTGVTCLVSQTPRDIHDTVSTDASKFSLYTATTPYGSATIRSIITQSVNIMGTTARTDRIDENNILISSLGTGSGNATRVNAASGDNPTPTYTSWDPSITVASYEAVVRGGVLRHDETDYSTGYLPAGPDYSSGRSGAQYFQVELIRSDVSQFRISYNGSCAGCWVCMPNNSAWTTSLSGVNGWADMFQTYRGSGIPTTSEPGCSSGGVMDSDGGTFTCVFGTQSSSNDTNNRILVRFKLTSGQSITALSFLNT